MGLVPTIHAEMCSLVADYGAATANKHFGVPNPPHLVTAWMPSTRQPMMGSGWFSTGGGAIAALLEQISTVNPPQKRRILFAPTLIERESCAPAVTR
jgi:hypothetical protein